MIKTRDDGWRLGHRPGLDGLRGIAIALVLLLHWWPATFPGGDTGVDLFFVLSGFLITRLLIEEVWRTGSVDLRGFYIRRARRLLPASGVLVLACITTPGALWVLVYGANWARIGGVLTGGPLEHTWSLAIEEQFYLVWPILLPWLLRLRSPWFTASVAALLIGAHRASIPDADWLRAVAGTDARADALLIGCAMALAATRLERVKNWPLLSALAAPAFALIVLDGTSLAGWGFTLTALGWAVVIQWGLTADGWLTASPLRTLGRLSYSLYLWHYPVTWLIRNGDMHDTSWPGTMIAIVASFALATASYLLVEHRFQVGRTQPVRVAGP